MIDPETSVRGGRQDRAADRLFRSALFGLYIGEPAHPPEGGRRANLQEDIMKRVGLGLALLCLGFGTVTATAQDKYPSKPVKIVVPYAPGGATDITTRLFGEQMRQNLGQQFIGRASRVRSAFSPSRKWRVRSPTATR
jgi:hypothetical protein